MVWTPPYSRLTLSFFYPTTKQLRFKCPRTCCRSPVTLTVFAHKAFDSQLSEVLAPFCPLAASLFLIVGMIRDSPIGHAATRFSPLLLLMSSHLFFFFSQVVPRFPLFAQTPQYFFSNLAGFRASPSAAVSPPGRDLHTRPPRPGNLIPKMAFFFDFPPQAAWITALVGSPPRPLRSPYLVSTPIPSLRDLLFNLPRDSPLKFPGLDRTL